MLINPGTLRTLGTGFNASYTRGLGRAASQRAIIATTIGSTTAANEYGWLGKFPKMREWVGDRAVMQLAASAYTIRNKDWELTVEVDRNDIEDDNLGIYAPMFEEMGMSTETHPDELCFGLLKAGFSTNCYDGQFYFDTDHPVLDENGVPQPVANTDGGSGAPWFLIDESRALKPIIFQERKKAQLLSKDKPDDDNVFMRKKFLYGVDARYNVGFSFWQFAWGSRQPLNAANYGLARSSMIGMKGDYGRPLGLRPSVLVVPPQHESAARKLVMNDLGAGGETNEWKGTARVEVCSWLA